MDVRSSGNHGEVNQRTKNMKAIKNLSIITGLFICCLTPFLIYSLIFAYDPIRYLRQPTLLVLYNITLLLLMANSLMNPIVYALRFKPFTVAFKIMLGLIKQEERSRAISDVIWMKHTCTNRIRLRTLIWRWYRYWGYMGKMVMNNCIITRINIFANNITSLYNMQSIYSYL